MREDDVARRARDARRGAARARPRRRRPATRPGRRADAWSRWGRRSLRLLESSVAAAEDGSHRCSGATRGVFILPGPHGSACADVLLTNFHLPRSTLFMLVCAFARHRSGCGTAYAHAVAARLPVLLLRRCVPAGPRMREFPLGACMRADGAARAGAHAHRPWGRWPRRPSCRWARPATVKAMTADCGARRRAPGIVLGNTYHLMLRPGRRAGGCGWAGCTG